MRKILFYMVIPAVLCMAVVSAAAAVAHEARFGKIHKAYILNEDGSQEMRVKKELTLYTHAAMNSLYGETFIVYDPAYQELVIHESYTVQKDGNIVKTPANAFVEVLPSAAANAPAYNGLREMVVVHTGLELGATIHLDYSIITKPGALKALDIFETVEELSPVSEYVFSVTVPENTPVAYELINGTAKASVRKTDGTKTVTWKMRNVNPRPRSLEVSVQAGSLQAIAVSTYPSRQAALDVIEGQLPDGTEAALQQKIRDLSRSGKDMKAAIGAYVNSLGNCGLTLAQTGFRIRPVSEVMQSAYGTAAEKKALAIGLLKAAGLPGDMNFVFYRTSSPDAAGLSALRAMTVVALPDAASNAVADIQSYLSVTDLDGNPAELPAVNHKVVKEGTLTVSSGSGNDMGNGYRSYLIPDANEGWLRSYFRSTTANTSRSASLLLAYLPDETYTCRIKVEEGMRAVILPQDIKLDNEAGTVRVSVVKTADGYEIVRSLKLKKQLVTKALYPEYYALMAEWNEVSASPVVFCVTE